MRGQDSFGSLSKNSLTKIVKILNLPNHKLFFIPKNQHVVNKIDGIELAMEINDANNAYFRFYIEVK